jgi:hypothetical protein
MIILCCALPLVLLAISGKFGKDAENIQAETEAADASNAVEGEAPTAEEDALHGTYETAQARLASMTKVAEEGGKELYFDNSYAEIAVLDIKTGETWFSTPYNFKKDFSTMDSLTVSDDAKAQLSSILKLTYYDSQMTELKMNSYSECISKKKPQFTIQPIENGIRINMQLGLVKAEMMLPEAAEAVRFEEKVISKLNEKDARKINTYYDLISLTDPKLSDAVKTDRQKNYPGLAEHDFYVLRRVSDRERRLIEEIIKKTEYSMEDFTEDQVLSGYVSEETATALFSIPVEFSLNQGDLVVNIPADEIEYDKEEFALASITLCEFLGAGNTLEEGYLFIPDGSGTLINYNTDRSKLTLYTTNTVYGDDYSIYNQWWYTSLKKQLHLPIFGNKELSKAYLAIIEEGDAMAKIYSESGNQLTYFETAFAEFNYATSRTVNYLDETKMRGMYTYHDRNYYQGDYRIRYRLLTGENANYVGMAKTYQDYLVQNGVLTKLENTPENTPLYLETVGSIKKKDTFLGFSYDKAINLTTFEEAQSILADLKDQGIDSLNLRYKGWMNGGLNYTVADEASVEKSLGGSKGLKKLNEYAKANNIGFFPDVDFFMARDNKQFDSYVPSWHSPRTLSRDETYLISPEEMTNLTFLEFIFYSVSPNMYNKYMKGFFKDYNKLKVDGVSMGNIGTMLYADYNKKAAVTREEAQDLLTNNLDTYITGQKNLMTDGGNAYVLKYSSDIVNLPLTDSVYTLADENIPFMQLVLHGYINYAGTPINLSSNVEDIILKSVEYGSNLFFTLANDNTEEFKQTPYSYLFSIDYSTWRQEIIDQYKSFNEVYRSLQNQSMVDHMKLENNVYQTTYEDGTKVIVNYNDSDVTVNGKTVEAKNFVVLK